MNICILELAIPPHTVGGAEIQAWELARRLAKKHTVTLVVRQYDSEAIEEQRDGVRIRRIPVLASPFTFLSHVCRYLAMLRRMRKTLDVVVAFRVIPNGVVSAIARRLWGIPCCTSVRGLDWYNSMRTAFGRRVLRWAARGNNVTHAQTSRIAADVHALTRDTAPVIIPNGVALCEERASGNSVLYVGGLNPHKGIDVLLAAMQHLPGKQLLVVGSGPETDKLVALARGMSVRFLGRVSPAEVHAIMLKEGRVLVLPTVTSEGMPNVVIQAMSVHLPVVATRVPGGVTDIVRDDETGLLVPPGDPVALAAAIRRLDEEPYLRAKLISAANEQVETFAWPHVIREWETLLGSLMQ